MSKRVLQLVLCLLVCCVTQVIAQKGTAPPGFYPNEYGGDTWTGEVTATDESKRELTLSYGSGDKAKTFNAYIGDYGVISGNDESGNTTLDVGLAPASLSKAKLDALPHLRVADLMGRHITVYYIPRQKKDPNTGEKTKFNDVFRIVILQK